MTQWRTTTISGLVLLAFSLGLIVPGSLSQETPSTEAPLNVTEKPAPVLTGDPQKDYIHDPNLPRELRGFNLSNYPFYKRVPDVEFNFTCDDRHDGFYASIPHQCQVYHHCLFGVRYDFLCANYTAFDQTNFICHFANEVDCKNSELHFYRNNALYKEEPTTTKKPDTPNIKIVYVDRPVHQRKPPGPPKFGGFRRKTTPRPADDNYYYDYQDDETAAENENYYYDDETQTATTTPTSRIPQRRPNRRPLRTRGGSQSNKRVQAPRNNQNVGQEVRRQQSGIGGQGAQKQNRPLRKRRRRKKTTTSTTTTTTPEPEYYEDEYYDEYEYYYDDETTTTTTTTTQSPLRRKVGQGRRQSPQARRKALLQARNSQLQGPTKIQPLTSRNAPSASADIVYDDITTAGNGSIPVVEDFPQDLEQTPTQNARRPGAFKRPRNRQLRTQASGA